MWQMATRILFSLIFMLLCKNTDWQLFSVFSVDVHDQLLVLILFSIISVCIGSEQYISWSSRAMNTKQTFESWIFFVFSQSLREFFCDAMVGILSTTKIRNQFSWKFDITLELNRGWQWLHNNFCSLCVLPVAKAEALRLFTNLKWKFSSVAVYVSHRKLNFFKNNLTWKWQSRWFQSFKLLNFSTVRNRSFRFGLDQIEAKRKKKPHSRWYKQTINCF